MTKNRYKNRSKRIGNGRTLQTRDEYFYGQSNYCKPGYKQKGNYRKVVVIDSNELDELAVVKLTTSDKGVMLDYGNGKSKFRPYVLTKDDSGAPIKAGSKFVSNLKKKNVSSKDVAKIKKVSFNDANEGMKNRNRVRKLKGRHNNKK